MNDIINITPFKGKLENSKIISNSHFGNIKFLYNIEKISQRTILRFSFFGIDEIYEIDFDEAKKQGLVDVESYFKTVIDNLYYQVIEYKEGKLDDFDIDENDLNFLKHFEKLFDDFHTGQ